MAEVNCPVTPALFAKLRAAFASVGEPEPDAEFFRRLLYASDFEGGLYAAWIDSEGRPWAWVGVYHEQGARQTLPLYQFKKFLAIVALHPQIAEIHMTIDQNPNPKATGRILERLGFSELPYCGPVRPYHYAARTPQWEKYHDARHESTE